MSLTKEHAEQIERWTKDAAPAQFVTLVGGLLADFLMHPRGADRRADLPEEAVMHLNDARSSLREARGVMLDAEMAEVAP